MTQIQFILILNIVKVLVFVVQLFQVCLCLVYFQKLLVLNFLGQVQFIENKLSINSCGKIIVPTEIYLDKQLDILAERGTKNGAKVEYLDENPEKLGQADLENWWCYVVQTESVDGVGQPIVQQA